MRALDRKLLRDLVRLAPQALAVSAVLACGVATLILAVGAYRSLEVTRAAYYERNRFGSIFASATRAPMELKRRIEHIDGVMTVDARIADSVLLDIPGMPEPATGKVLSIPDYGEAPLNRLYLRAGRLPEPGQRGDVVVSATFAEAHGFHVGSKFSGTLSGHKVTFRIAGLALSPEYIYAVGPGEIVPDPRRFAILWMRRTELAGLTDLKDAFNDVSLALLPHANETAVIEALDRLLAPYGGTGAYPRKDQTSHAFLDSELTQLQAMARVIPPVFLLVSAFLVNMILSRLIALEREQIGLLKALGYSRVAIAGHYVKLVLVICAVGIVLGIAAGLWLGRGMTEIYAEFFHFPFLIFQRSVNVSILAASISTAAALAGGLKAVYSAASLPPATAMRPESPPRYRRTGFVGRVFSRLFSQLSVMAVRHIVRWPARAATTTLGNALAVALLVTALFTTGAVNFLIDVMYFRTERQDATVTYSKVLAPEATFNSRHLPGVLSVEPFRVTMAQVSHGSRSRRIPITGKLPAPRLSRVLDLDLAPVKLPSSGLVLTERVAHHLDARRGDKVRVRLYEEGNRGVTVPVVDVVQSYMGLGAYMDIDALDRLSRVGPRRSGVYVELDSAKERAVYDAIKKTPVVAGIALRRVSLEKFRETISQNINIMTVVYVVLAVIIAFGVIYNSARIQLSERARELASLRVLGFTRGEVARVLAVELTIVALAAQPLGWLIGYSLSYAVVTGLQSDLFRVPFHVDRAAFAWSSIVVLSASVVSAAIVLARVRNLDMIRVLKTKE